MKEITISVCGEFRGLSNELVKEVHSYFRQEGSTAPLKLGLQERLCAVSLSLALKQGVRQQVPGDQSHHLPPRGWHTNERNEVRRDCERRAPLR